MLKKSMVSLLLVGVVALALASSGGGDKKKSNMFTPEFTPIRTSSGFSMQAGVRYSGSLITATQKGRYDIHLKSLVTYQKGNTVYILPNKHRIGTLKPAKTNLNLVDVKIKLHK